MVALLYLVLLAAASGWPGWRPIVVGFVLALLMVAVLWLYDPVAPLTEALEVVLAGHPRRLRDHRHRRLHPRRHHVGALPGQGAPARPRDRLAGAGARARGAGPDLLPDPRVRLPGVDLRGADHRPIWAHQAWSSYWNWDPKEVWAFITWVVYAAYLHARSTAGWKGRNAAILALVGLATLWFNFIGINYFSTTSQHSYAGAPRARVARRRDRHCRHSPGRARARRHSQGVTGHLQALSRRDGSSRHQLRGSASVARSACWECLDRPVGVLGVLQVPGQLGVSGSSGCLRRRSRSRRKSGSSSGPIGRGGACGRRRGAGAMPRRWITRTVR